MASFVLKIDVFPNFDFARFRLFFYPIVRRRIDEDNRLQRRHVNSAVEELLQLLLIFKNTDFAFDEIQYKSHFGSRRIEPAGNIGCAERQNRVIEDKPFAPVVAHEADKSSARYADLLQRARRFDDAVVNALVTVVLVFADFVFYDLQRIVGISFGTRAKQKRYIMRQLFRRIFFKKRFNLFNRFTRVHRLLP